MAEKNYAEQVVVITGASSGFGRGAALKFAKAGASVVIAARRDDLLEDLAAECEAAGGKALVVPTDVGIPDEVEELCNQALQTFGRIDVWVNNAGVGAIGRFDEVPLADPEDEVSVGGAGASMMFLHGLIPGVEDMMAKETRKVQMEKAPPEGEKTGSVFEPEQEGPEVTGGWKKR